MKEKYKKIIEPPSVHTTLDDLDTSLNVTAKKFANFAMTTNERLKGLALQME